MPEPHDAGLGRRPALPADARAGPVFDPLHIALKYVLKELQKSWVTFFRRHVQSKQLSCLEVFQGCFQAFFGDIESILYGSNDRQRNLSATFIIFIM